MVWADDASSITCLAVPTSRNLAVASPGVNKFNCLGYANVRQKWLPSLGTCVSPEELPVCQGCLCTSSKIHPPAETFYSPWHRHRQHRHERFIKSSGRGRFCSIGTLDVQTCTGPTRFKLGIFRARFHSTTLMSKETL
jgi:hypothetical protein